MEIKKGNRKSKKRNGKGERENGKGKEKGEGKGERKNEWRPILGKQKEGAASLDEILFGSQIIMVYMVFEPPSVVSWREHWRRSNCKEPTIPQGALEDQPVIALVGKHEKIDVDPRANQVRNED